MLKKLLVFLIIFLSGFGAKSQLVNHYWTHAFNSTSSLLGGAVVAGDGDNSSLYYNPATISQMGDGSNLSIAANLFTWNVYKLNNAVGNGLDLDNTNFSVQPQFFSYTYKPKNSKFSLAASVLTRLKERMEMSYANSTYKDVIKAFPGDEKYNTVFNYRNDYTDTWLGGGFAHDVSDNFSYGASLFVSASTLIYEFGYSASTYNVIDSSFINPDIGASIVSDGTYQESMRFTDYKLVLKIGLAYKIGNWRLGLNFTSPTWRLFSSGKKAIRIDTRSNIFVDGKKLPDYVIFDAQDENVIKTNYKLPYSIAFGFIWDRPERNQKFYFTTEYFGRLKVYKMVDAPMNSSISSPDVVEQLENKDWLSFVYGARPVLNLAIGYSWKIRKKLTFLNALRTDLSAINSKVVESFGSHTYMKASTFNIYHYSGGVEFSIKQSKIIAGGDIGFGYRKNEKQLANFSDPVEYDPIDKRSLQGPLTNAMNTYYFGFSIYIGVTFNFIRQATKPKNN